MGARPDRRVVLGVATDCSIFEQPETNEEKKRMK